MIRRIALGLPRVAVGVALATAGALKLGDPLAFQARLLDLLPIDRPLAAAIALGLPPLEVAVGACLVAGVWRGTALALAGLLLAGFATTLLAAGTGADCGCFGALLPEGTPGTALVRNLGLLALLAAAVAVETVGTDRARVRTA